jgi:hypothetical protein
MGMNKWSTCGSLVLMLGGLGHFVIVDLSALQLQAAYVQWSPASPIAQLKQTVVDWGWLGSSNAFLIFSGFSVWITLSMILLGTYNLVIFRHLPRGHRLRKLSLKICLIVAVIFLTLASICFIYAPVAGAAIAVLLFGMAIRKEGQ